VRSKPPLAIAVKDGKRLDVGSIRKNLPDTHRADSQIRDRQDRSWDLKKQTVSSLHRPYRANLRKTRKHA
jgi:hypothetical protein